MKKYLILGTGSVGIAIRNTLRVIDLNCEITCADSFPRGGAVQADLTRDFAVFDSAPFDCVISALPFKLNERLAQEARNRNYRWIDLGGNFQSSERIQQIYKDGPACYTDLGLAPGLMSILSWWPISQTPKSVELYCGGLTEKVPNNQFKYVPTFNVDGLINEYMNDCYILESGVEKQVPSLTVDSGIDWKDKTLEAFVTSGGVEPGYFDLMRKKGVSNVAYRTLRYPGHVNHINLLRGWGISNDKIATRMNSEHSTCMLDIIVMQITYGFEDREETYQFHIRDSKKHTAMQRATAFPVAIAATQFADGQFDNKGGRITSRDLCKPSMLGDLKALDLWEGIPSRGKSWGWFKKTVEYL